MHAVDDVSFEIVRGEIFGLVGESGSGKTTIGRLLLRLIFPTSGNIFFDGKNILSVTESEMNGLRRQMQMVFQDPFDSLNTMKTVYDIIKEPLIVHNLVNDEGGRKSLVKDILRDVGLTPPESFLDRYPRELSGGQRQRVAIARVLILKPRLLVLDEPVSMLDVSVRAGILQLMMEMREKRGLSFLFITHDLARARHTCDRVAVMYLGEIVELGDTEEVIYKALHPYTMALVSAVPRPDPDDLIEVKALGETPNAVRPPSGCRFHPRCMYADDICRIEKPALEELRPRHYVACHKASEILNLK